MVNLSVKACNFETTLLNKLKYVQVDYPVQFFPYIFRILYVPLPPLRGQPAVLHVSFLGIYRVCRGLGWGQIRTRACCYSQVRYHRATSPPSKLASFIPLPPRTCISGVSKLGPPLLQLNVLLRPTQRHYHCPCCDYALSLTQFLYFQNEKNQIMKSNVWLRLVRRIIHILILKKTIILQYLYSCIILAKIDIKTTFKGTVQRKLMWVKSSINRQTFF